MNLTKYKYSTLLFAGLALASCENEVDLEISASAGTADFSNYVAIGNSLTAGFADGGLYEDSQNNSFPSMIAMRMAEVDPSVGTFVQPSISGNGSGYITLDALNGTSPVLGAAAPDASFAQKVDGPFNNMGVPGIRTIDIGFEGYGADFDAGNPFFWRMLPATAPLTTYAEAVVATNPTFFTCWLGNNDVLGYATSGGAAGVNGAPGTFLGGISPTPLFDQAYRGLIAGLTADGSTKGVVATIPNVTDIPYFTTVPGAPIIPLDAATAGALMSPQAYGGFNAAVAGWNNAIDLQGLPESLKREMITFAEGNNFPVIVDNSLSDAAVPTPDGGTFVIPKVRQLRFGELLTLTTPTSEFAAGLGTANAIGDEYVLTTTELGYISTAISEYNAIIRNVAETNPNVALWDANAAFSNVVANGYTLNGVSIDARFILGGAFSLDGVHPTPRGYAWVANSFMNVINSEFGATLEPMSIGQYRGVEFP